MRHEQTAADYALVHSYGGYSTNLPLDDLLDGHGGPELAQKAAQAVGGKVVAPIFNEEERARGLTDFNDLHQSRGLGEVKMQVGLGLQHDKTQEKFHQQGKTRELSL